MKQLPRIGVSTGIGLLACAAWLAAYEPAMAQANLASDPGVRGGAPDAGSPLPGLGKAERAFFQAALDQFTTIDSVTGSLPGESGGGLGPRFNGNVCSSCHAFPAIGGSSPPVNPQVAFAKLDGGHNEVPSFITRNGPVEEMRLRVHADGTPDGQVHPLFVISGRTDAPGCHIHQPDIGRQILAGNVALRIPSSLFGLGLVENVPDAGLVAAQTAHSAAQAAFGTHGYFNHDANDGSISRFGWKAQDKSLLTFAGEAYNVEQGVSNEVFPSELSSGPDCMFTNQPEDSTFFRNTIHSGSASSDFTSATANFAVFIRLLAPPQPAPLTKSAAQGQFLFRATGCESCHFETLKTTASVYTGQSGVIFHPYSDFALHRMGAGLADGVVQGEARGNEFRTAPLWGIGQRLFFLHDGRTSDLVTAIDAHASAGSQANGVIARFKELTPAQRQSILDYLRSL